MGNINLNSELFVDLYSKAFTKHFGNYNLEFKIYTKEEAEQLTSSGIYMFINSEKPQKIIYIGQTKCFSERLPNHERWNEAKKLGADRVAIALVNKRDLDKIEKLLIQECKPLLNEQHNTDERKRDEFRSALKQELSQR